MKGISHVIFSIVFGLVAVAGIVWGIWYEGFAGEEPKMTDSEKEENFDSVEDVDSVVYVEDDSEQL